MNQPPETRYAKAGKLNIAYQMFGEGNCAVVVIPGLLNTIETTWSFAEFARFYRRLAKFARVALLDKRGTGLSDRLPEGGQPTTAERAEDIVAVMDAIGVDKAALISAGDGAPVAATFAATYPQRAEALVIVHGWARLAYAPDYPVGVTEDARIAWLELVERRWGSDTRPLLQGRLVRRLADDAEWRLALARIQRLAASPNAAVALYRAMYDVDVRNVLPAIAVPTLVLHARDDGVIPIDHGRYLAENIPGARLVELDGADHMLSENTELVAGIIQEFLTGRRPEPDADRRVVTMLFTDIVGSTSTAAAIGNRRWADLLDKHDERVLGEIRNHGGRVVDTAGDGVFALFGGPRQAIACAESIRKLVRPLQLELRAGVHTGEVEMRDQRVMGMAVHIGARIAAIAQAGETLASRTVKDLVVGSGIRFDDRGLHTLKGVPDEWQLFSVQPPKSGSP